MNKGFEYFPEKLYSKPVKISNWSSTKMFGMSKPREVFYSCGNGNWLDPSTWETVSGRTGKLPTYLDDVYIKHTVTLNSVNGTTVSVNNLFVSGYFLFDNQTNRGLEVVGNLQATGTIDLTTTGTTNVLYLNGTNNYINNFIAGTTTTVYYERFGDQNVMNLSYWHLTIATQGTKYLTSNLTIGGNLTVGFGVSGSAAKVIVFELLSYDLTVNGTTSLFGYISKISGGNVTFVGLVTFQNNYYCIDFSLGNPNVECRGGLSLTNQPSFDAQIKTGTGTWSFTTNNQSIALNSGGTSAIQFNGAVSIVGNITLTLASSGANTNQNVLFAGGVNGTTSSSTLANQALLWIPNSTLPMQTGVFDFTTSTKSTLYFYFNGNYTLPYTAYQGLTIGGTGTKTAMGNTTLTSNLFVGGNNGNLELSTYNLTVTGTSTFNTGYLSKSGAGSIIFIGQAIFTGTPKILDLSGGNPTIEFRGGWSTANQTSTTMNFGTGAMSFTTNNQTLSDSGVSTLVISNNITISGAITVTYSGGTGSITISGTLNGNNASSTFDNRVTVAYQNATQPMATGKLYCNQAANTWLYNLNGAQDITTPGDPTPGYKNLTLSVGGVKKLLGNVSVKGVYTLSVATLNSNGFALTNP